LIIEGLRAVSIEEAEQHHWHGEGDVLVEGVENQAAQAKIVVTATHAEQVFQMLEFTVRKGEK
jgi:hypothetical protein